MKNHYTTLEVSQDATFLDIRKAYLTLSKKVHPDKNDDSGATEKFKALNEAYEVLSDPEKRKTFQNQFSQMQKQQEYQRQQDLQRKQEFQRKQQFQRQSEFQRQQWDKFEQRVIHIQKQQELERQWELRRQQKIQRQHQQELIRQKEMKWQQELERNQEIRRQKELQKQQFLHMKKQMQRQQELKNQLELKRQQEMQEMQNNFSKIAIDESILEAFMEAAKTGNLDACKYMIEKVKNICDSADEEKTTAIHYAAENGHLQVR